LRVGDTLRHVAHVGTLRFIYEIPREHGGVAWRAAETGEIQLVEDVRRDPDYLASDERVTSEVAAPVGPPGSVVAVLDAEFPDRVFSAAEAAQVESAAARLGRELADRTYAP
jgi:putative methionine-R-sulfoxide reductase with GAF domain